MSLRWSRFWSTRRERDLAEYLPRKCFRPSTSGRLADCACACLRLRASGVPIRLCELVKQTSHQASQRQRSCNPGRDAEERDFRSVFHNKPQHVAPMRSERCSYAVFMSSLVRGIPRLLRRHAARDVVLSLHLGCGRKLLPCAVPGSAGRRIRVIAPASLSHLLVSAASCRLPFPVSR